MKIGITGGYGFIGSYLAKYFKDRNHEVFIYDGDVLDKGFLEIWAEGLEHVIHLAATIKGDPNTIFINNMIGSLNVLNACYKNKCILHFAGIPQKRSYSDPEKDFYFNSKNIFEDCLSTYATYETDTDMLTAFYYRIPNVVGPGCKPFYNSFLSTLMYCVKNNVPYEHLIKDPKAVIEFTTVQQLASEIETKIVNINQNNYSVLFVSPLTTSINIEDFVRCLKEGFESQYKPGTVFYHELVDIAKSYEGYKLNEQVNVQRR